MEAALSRVVALLPRELSLCFAYGSGALRQAGAAGGGRVLDVVVVAPNALLFHQENLKRNPRHYSAMRWLGALGVARLQEAGAAAVYYNTLLPLPPGAGEKADGRMFKYGVISAPALETDLLDWNALYLAGRLHKPVLLVQDPRGPEGPRLARAMRSNLHSALHAALLLLPETFTERELYKTICGLSYEGDFRMILGENPRKVQNIVDGQLELFQQLYAPVITGQSNYVHIANGQGSQDVSATGKLFHLTQLPRRPQTLLAREWSHRARRRTDAEAALLALAHSVDADAALRRALRQIVSSASIFQSLKGILTAGPIKSIRYAAAKIAKQFAKR